MTQHVIGIDFDNTIVCYDDVFHLVAVERQLIPSRFPRKKEKIRNYLRMIDREDAWTEMQGYVYGRKMSLAKPFPGVIDFFKMVRQRNIPIYIISHKTRHPYLGPQYDLHQAAQEWIDRMQLNQSDVFFLESKKSKIEKIAECQCTH